MLRKRTKEYGKGIKETKMRVYEGEALDRRKEDRWVKRERVRQ